MNFSDLILFVYNACVDFIEFSDVVLTGLTREVPWLNNFSIWECMFGAGFLVWLSVNVIRN